MNTRYMGIGDRVMAGSTSAVGRWEWGGRKGGMIRVVKRVEEGGEGGRLGEGGG